VQWPTEANDAANKVFVNYVANSKLPLNGGVLRGDIDMGENKLRNSNPNKLHKDELFQKQWIETFF